MKGNNTLTLNEATVVEALQEYFANRTTPRGLFRVRSVREHQDHRKTFVVETESPEDAE